jgi:hypothetical protein
MNTSDFSCRRPWKVRVRGQACLSRQTSPTGDNRLQSPKAEEGVTGRPLATLFAGTPRVLLHRPAPRCRPFLMLDGAVVARYDPADRADETDDTDHGTYRRSYPPMGCLFPAGKGVCIHCVLIAC